MVFGDTIIESADLALNLWFFDDGTLAMKKEDIQRAVGIILEMGPPRGLFLSTARTIPPPLLPKLTVWSPSNTMTNDDPLERDIPRVEEASIVLLGTPRNTDHLPHLQDTHIVFVLLRSCLALPKIMYTLLTVDPTNYQTQWQEFDMINWGGPHSHSLLSY